MSDYTVFVGVDISAKTATVSWGTSTHSLTKPTTIQQNPQAWQHLTDEILVFIHQAMRIADQG